MASNTGDVWYKTQDGDMLDLICWRHYGTSHLTVELVLDTNYKLSEQPPVLPIGLNILLPAYTPPSPAAKVQIWN